MQLRLNENGRTLLRGLAAKVISCPTEESALAAAYKKAVPLVRKIVEEKYPPRDMRVLQKYEAASLDDCIKIQLTAGGVTTFDFAKGTGPLVAKKTYNGAIYLADDAATDAVTEWQTARDAHKKAMKTKTTDYEALIVSARTLEQVADVWPEAEELRGKLSGTTLVVLSNDVIARIKADVAQRAA